MDPGGLYSFDFVRPWASFALYSAGLSMNPDQAIVGKDGWLFLGNDYESNVDYRRGVDANDEKVRDRLGAYTSAWKSWFVNRGVQQYIFMVAPDKDTIYAENLPDWEKPSSRSQTSFLTGSIAPDILLNTVPVELAVKKEVPWPIYHLADSHWNHYGAWRAFQVLTSRLAANASVKRFADTDFTVKDPVTWLGGDLSNLLYIRSFSTSDVEVQVDLKNWKVVEPKQFDFGTGQGLKTVGNPEVGSPVRPLLVVSPNALNKKRVLWLRDSFGSGMSPFMAQTFSDVVQLHYEALTQQNMDDIIARFRPEIVIVTVAERKLRSAAFATRPR